MKYSVILLIALLGINHAIAGPHDWTQWRGPNQAAITEITNLPVSWSDEEDMAWQTELPGAGASQPVVADGKIFVTSWSGYNPGTLERGETRPVEGLKFHITCVSAETGEILGDVELEPMHQMEQSARNVGYHGFATPTPLIDGDRLFVALGPGGLYCLDLNGNIIWQRSIGDKVAGWGYAASLADLDNMLLVNASVESGQLLAIDKETGETIWSNAEGMDFEKAQSGWYDRSWTTPMVWSVNGKPRIALLVVGQHLQVYDPADGKILWTVPRVSGGYSCNTPMPNEDGTVLYCMAGGSHGTTTSSAIRAEDDVPDNQRVIWKHEGRGAALVPPVLFQGRLLFASYGGVKPPMAEGIGAMDPATGEIIYLEKPEELKRNANVYASPLVGEGRMYVQTLEHGVFVVDATTAEYKLLAHNTLTGKKSPVQMKIKADNGFNPVPVPLEGGRLLLRSYWGLHCVEAGK